MSTRNGKPAGGSREAPARRTLRRVYSCTPVTAGRGTDVIIIAEAVALWPCARGGRKLFAGPGGNAAVEPPSREIPGVVHFDAARSLTDPDTYVVIEVFENRQALERQNAQGEVAKGAEPHRRGSAHRRL